MTEPHANTIAGVVQWLLTSDLSPMVDGRIYGIELPEADNASMPRRAVVIGQSGRAGGLGDNSYAKIGRPRFDLRCYGDDAHDARTVYGMVEALMKELRRTTVDLGDGTAVMLANATISGGPLDLRDGSGQWPMTWAAFGIAAHEQTLVGGSISS